MHESTVLTGSPGQLLKPIEVAQVLHVSMASVYRKIASGELEAFRIGRAGGPLRIPAVAVEKLLSPVISSLAGDETSLEVELAAETNIKEVDA